MFYCHRIVFKGKKIASNLSSDIDFKDFMIVDKDYTK